MVKGCGFACALLVGGCVDPGGPQRNQFSSPAALDAAVDSVYAQLPHFWGREQSAALSQAGTDTWSAGAGVTETTLFGVFEHQYEFGTYTFGLQDTWSALYGVIARANTVLDRSGPVPGMTDAALKARVGEARFLRALAYFYLVQTWGGVTLNLHERDALNPKPTRASPALVYSTIVADLDSAIACLPASSGWGRATKGAAQHLLARVYLTRAYKDFGAGANDFRRALELADAVIGSGVYSLVPVYADLWCGPHRAGAPADPNRQGFCDLTSWSEQNAEVIFPVVFGSNPPANLGNALHLEFLGSYDARYPGLARDLDNGRPFRRGRPLPLTIWLFDQVRWAGAPGASDIRDTRFDGSFQTLWFANRVGAGDASAPCPRCTSGAPIAPGDTALWMPGYYVSDSFRQARKYAILVPCTTPPSEDCGRADTGKMIYDGITYPALKKYGDNLRPDPSTLEGSKDLVLMRLGETYLLAAEAAVGLGDPARAAAYVNVLRRRAASAAHKSDNDVAPAGMWLDFIMEERERELSGELNRWYDLVRPGPEFYLRRIRTYNPYAAPVTQAYHALLPIPQQQLDQVPGYGQNPGY